MSLSFISPIRIGFLKVVVALAFVVLIGRFVYLHVFEHERLSRIVEHNRENMRTLYSKRGDIVDARGNLLAATREVFEVGVDPQAFDQEEDGEKLVELAKILELPESEVLEKCNRRLREVEGPNGVEKRDVRWVVIAEAVNQEVYGKVNDLKIKSVYGNRKFQRHYPGSSLASHLLGFVNKEGVPSMGVEQYMQFYLQGQDGWREFEHDGRRREMAQFKKREVSPTDGMGVQLTLDLVIQHIVEEELVKIARDYNPESATIIVSEPSTGDILAMANFPDFDPNLFFKYKPEELKNRAISDIIEPGSTFKAVTVAAALNEGVTRASEVFDCGQSVVNHKDRDLRLPSDSHPNGRLSVTEILVKSSNRGAAFIGVRLGEDKLYRYARDFGFGQVTNIGPAGEEKGILHPVSRWDGLTITRMPMGHAVSATPLQIHFAMSVIANDGVLVKPRLIKRAYSSDGKLEISFDPSPRNRVIKPEIAREVAKMLMGVVRSDGTAHKAEIPGYEIAGKTGTTQKIVDGRYSHTAHVASFIGFFPASRPKLMVSVIINEPKMTKGLSGYGGVVAAPAFHDVSEKLIRYMGMKPVNGEAQVAWKGGPLDWSR